MGDNIQFQPPESPCLSIPMPPLADAMDPSPSQRWIGGAGLAGVEALAEMMEES